MPEPQSPETAPASRPTPGRPHGADAARERADRVARGLTRLPDARPELLGVHAPADWAYDAIRWTV
jgi:hypothetical protein